MYHQQLQTQSKGNPLQKLFIIAAMFLAACSQTAEKIETAANRSTTSWAMGKPYNQVASLGNSTLAQLSTEQYGFGQMIGQSSLQDGSILYRHIAPSAEAESGSDFAGLVGKSKKVTNYRLSYFKVGQDGIVKDWATGSVPGTFSSCVTYIGGVFQKCNDQGRVRQALVSYDSSVRTSSNNTIDSWGSFIPVPGIQ